MANNIKVVVRCRPLNAREIARGAKGLIRMEGVNTYLDPPSLTNVSSGSRISEKEVKSFAFDRSYWSACGQDEEGYASQQTVYDDLGKDLLDHSFEGFNTCIFAYGQTGSGKSYSMMGYGADRGIIPLICEALFERIALLTTSELTFTVEVSYTEIYQEKVRDLLNPRNKTNLKVREHPTLGPYVESLSKLAVQSFIDVEALMNEGTKARTVAATNMNETSSRSHAVFTLLLTQRRLDPTTNLAGEKVSRISLVDLAGSERANATGATGTRLKEGALINKSLTTLGRVIAALAAASTGGSKGVDKVPYRDSVLTWLLKDSLGGNSKTAMIAAISPADYEETLSTLRYADQAKKIKNKAVVNEDPNAKLIRELKEELAILRVRMSGSPSTDSYDPNLPASQQLVQYRTKDGELRTISKAELQDQLEASERLMASVTETWEEKLVRTREVQEERERALEALGITIEKNLVGVHTPKKMPHLVNLNEDPLMSECLIYQIKPGKTLVGNLSETAADIRLSGDSILPEHCFFENSPEGKVVLHAMADSTTMVNGQRIAPDKPKELRSGFRIILGDFHVFRFNHPEEVRRARDAGGPESQLLRSPLTNGYDDTGSGTPVTRSESPLSTAENADWSYARREAVVARLNGANVNLDTLKDDDLNKLYAEILKVRHSRTGTQSVASTDTRSESQMDFLDSVTEDGDEYRDDMEGGSPWKRPGSGMTWSTGETSVGDSTLTMSSPPEMEERVQAVVEEYEAKMKVQKERYENRVKQLKVSPTSPVDDGPMSLEEERLARGALVKWRRRRRVRIAEDLLTHAVTIKEANVVSAELNKGVVFQFLVVQADIPLSACESIGGLAELDDLSDVALSSSLKPCIGVKVLDRHNNVVSIWSLPKLQQRLQQMRNLYKFIDNPEYSQHFSWEDPFYESPPLPGNYSFVGTAQVSLALLSRNLPSSSTLQIGSPYTADPIGTCRVSIKPISVVNPTEPALPLGSHTSFVEGSELSFEIYVDKVDGLTKAEFTLVHLQLHLSSFFGPNPDSDELFSSDSIDLETTGTGELKIRCTLTIKLTPKIHQFLAESYGRIDFFARIKPAHLDKIERWDEARDASVKSKVANTPSLRGDPDVDVTRRPEDDLVSEQRHDVMASLEIRELDETGEYVAVPVVSHNALDAGAFFLRQGLQRRVVLHLSHNSGRGWPWKRVSKVTLGNVRMLDARARIHAATTAPDVELRATNKRSAVFGTDGTSSLAFTSPWDSSVHDSPFLNRNTAANHRPLLQLSWEIEADNCAGPVKFTMDVAVTIQNRDARGPSKLVSMLSSTRISSRITNLFAVRLTPAMTKSHTDVWRLDTSETFVRGEEVLGSWKPRGLSLIRDYDQLSFQGRRAADVEAAKSILAAFELTLPAPAFGLGVDKGERLARVVEMWQKTFGAKADVSLERKPVAEILDLSTPVSPPSPVIPRDTRLIGHVALIPKTDTAARRGNLAMLRDPTSSKWKKYWIVLRRPYLHLYESSSETEETAVINVSTVRVEQSPEIEQMLERKYSFAIFTHQNSYFFQAPTAKDMHAWIRAIDPSLA